MLYHNMSMELEAHKKPLRELILPRSFIAGGLPGARVAAEAPAGPAQAGIPGQVPRQDRRPARGW